MSVGGKESKEMTAQVNGCTRLIGTFNRTPCGLFRQQSRELGILDDRVGIIQLNKRKTRRFTVGDLSCRSLGYSCQPFGKGLKKFQMHSRNVSWIMAH